MMNSSSSTFHRASLSPRLWSGLRRPQTLVRAPLPCTNRRPPQTPRVTRSPWRVATRCLRRPPSVTSTPPRWWCPNSPRGIPAPSGPRLASFGIETRLPKTRLSPSTLTPPGKSCQRTHREPCLILVYSTTAMKMRHRQCRTRIKWL